METGGKSRFLHVGGVNSHLSAPGRSLVRGLCEAVLHELASVPNLRYLLVMGGCKRCRELLGRDLAPGVRMRTKRHPQKDTRTKNQN